jgi:peptidoglycan/LPS O-acetylase OafA/YrhL
VDSSYRKDIDGLRGIAILAVLGFHFAPGVFSGGFVGVDVFFVISGYLITGILLDDHLTLTEFYVRRVRRLFPALAITLGLALLLGAVLLLPDEFKALCRNILAAATFTTNFVLMSDVNAGYFANLSINDQLIHLWSLSVEEQFYLFWPVTLFFTPRPYRMVVVSGLLVLFLAFDFINPFGGTLDRYYFPGNRFWEIFAGAWLAAIQPSQKARSRSVGSIGTVTGLLLIVAAIAFVKPTEQWPGLRALVPVLGAMLIIGFRSRGWFTDVLLANRLLVGIGLISYPLYLYHWMFLSFASQAYSGRLPFELKLGTLVVGVALSAATYRFVELPIRRGKYSFRRFAALPASAAAIFVVSGLIYLADGMSWRFGEALAFNDMPSKGFQRIDDSCLKKYGPPFQTVFYQNESSAKGPGATSS